MPNIDLARFKLDNSQLIKDAEEARKKFEKLRKEQAELRKEMRELQKKGLDETSKEFKALNSLLTDSEASVKAASREYSSYQRVLTSLASEVKDLELTQSQLDAVLNQEVNTIEKLRNQNNALNAIRNKTNIETEEGRKQLEEINKRLDENNKRIKENVDGYAKQKINIGNYRESVKGAISDLGGLNGMLGNTSTAMGIGLNAVRGMIAGLSQLTRASLAFIATPIGGVVTVLAMAIGAVSTAFSKSEESVDRLNTALAPLKGIFNALTQAVQIFGNMIIDNIINILDKASAGFENLMNWAEKALRFLGMESAADGLKGYNDNLRESINLSRELEQINQELSTQQRRMTIQNSAYRRELEALKVARDDANNSLEDRIRANEDIFRITEAQMNAERNLIEMRLRSVQILIKEGDKSAKILDEQASLTAQLIDLETRRDSENRRALRRRNSLNRDAAQQASEQRKLIIQGMEEELELFKLQNKAQEQSFQERLNNLNEQSEKERAILDARLNNGEISQSKYNAEIIKLELELSDEIESINKERQDELIDNLSKEIEAYQDRNREILESDKLLTDERLEELKNANQLIFEENQRALKQQFNENLISQKEYDDKLAEYKQQREEADAEAEAQKREQQKAEELELLKIEFEEEMERLREMGALREEVELEILKNQQEAKRNELDQQREQGIISEQLYNAKLEQMNNELNRAEIESEKAKLNNKIAIREQELQIANQLSEAITNLLGEQNTISKLSAGAMAMINTYEGVTKALAQGGMFGYAQAAAIMTQGLAMVRNIAKTNIPKSSGGGSVASGSGTDVSSQVLPNLTNSEDINQQNEGTSVLDMDELSENIINAVQVGAERGTERGSESGLIGLSENRAIQQTSIY